MSLLPTKKVLTMPSQKENLSKSIPEIMMEKYRYSDLLSSKKSSCPTGCHNCCYDFFYVSEMEFLTIIHYVKQHLGGFYLNKKIQQAKENLRVFASLYPQKYQELQTPQNPTRLKGSAAQDFLIINSDDSIDGTTTRLPFPCVFLNNHGCCDIYSVRPMVCRMYGSYCVKFAKGNICTNLKKAKLHVLSRKEYEVLARDELLINGIATRNYPIFDFLGLTYPRMEKLCNKFYLNPGGFYLQEFIQNKIDSLGN